MTFFKNSKFLFFISHYQAEELQARITEEVSTRTELNKDLESGKDNVGEIAAEIEERKSRLSSLTELKAELSNKLQVSTLAKARTEAQLGSAASARSETIREIEELRRQRDVLRRRVEFCREKDAIGTVAKSAELSCGFREYSAEQIRLATNGFSERLRLKPGGDWTTSFRGRINRSTVAIKMLDSASGQSQEDFHAKVKWVVFLTNFLTVTLEKCYVMPFFLIELLVAWLVVLIRSHKKIDYWNF